MIKRFQLGVLFLAATIASAPRASAALGQPVRSVEGDRIMMQGELKMIPGEGFMVHQIATNFNGRPRPKHHTGDGTSWFTHRSWWSKPAATCATSGGGHTCLLCCPPGRTRRWLSDRPEFWIQWDETACLRMKRE